MGDAKQNNLDDAEYLIGATARLVGCSPMKVKTYEKLLSTPVLRDRNENRRFTKSQIIELREIWLSRK